MSFVKYYAQANLNIRSGPSTSDNIVGSVAVGTLVEALVGGIASINHNANAESPYIDAEGNQWVYVRVTGGPGLTGQGIGWAAQKYGGKLYLLGTKPSDKPTSPTDKKPTAKVGPGTTTPTPTPQSQAKESSMLPMLLAGGAVVLLIAALKEDEKWG